MLPTPGKKRKVDLCKFEASLIYIINSRPARLNSETLAQSKTKLNKTKHTKKDAYNAIMPISLH